MVDKKKDERSLGDILGEYATGTAPTYRPVDAPSGNPSPSGPAASLLPEEHALWAAMYSGAAVLATRIGIVPFSGFLRIAFAEQQNQFTTPQFRAAVTLTEYNAWELYHLLGQSPAVQNWEGQYQESLKAAEKEASDGTDKPE